MYTQKDVEFYDLEHGAFEADFHLYSSYAMMTGGPLLELGCGTGRLMAPLIAAGYEVVGVDSSEAMLSRARERLEAVSRSGWKLVHSDLASIEMSEHGFGMVFCALNTWSHLIDPERALDVLVAANRALRAAGLLILDLEDPEHRSPGRGELLLSGVFRDGDQVVTKTVASSYDPLQGVEEVTVFWDKVVNGVVNRTVSQTRLRPYYRAEMEQLLSRGGFRVRECLGSWDLEPYAARGDRMIFICEPEPRQVFE